MKKQTINLNVELKDGDFVYYKDTEKCNESISIYKDGGYSFAAILLRKDNKLIYPTLKIIDNPSRFATELEKQFLLDALVKEGKQWNVNAKRLDKWTPKVGEFVTLDNTWISVYAGKGSLGNTISDFCGTYYQNEKFSDSSGSSVRDYSDIRPSTPFEIQRFHKLLAKSGKCWNAKVRCMEDLWRPKQGDFVTNVWPNGRTISIYNTQFDNKKFLSYCAICASGALVFNDILGIQIQRKSTLSECKELEYALRGAGKQWNAEKLCIEDLKVEDKWKPKRGEIVKVANTGLIFIFDKMNNDFYCGIKSLYFIGSRIKYGIPEMSRSCQPTSQEERFKFFEALKKVGLKYNTQNVDFLEEEWTPRDGDFCIGAAGHPFIYKSELKGKISAYAALISTGIIFNDEYFTNNAERLMTESEKVDFLHKLHCAGKDWDAANKKVVKLAWAPQKLTRTPQYGEVVKSLGSGAIFIYDGIYGNNYQGCLGNLFLFDGTIFIGVHKMCLDSVPTTQEEQTKFFDELSKAGWYYDPDKVELKKIWKPKDGDFVTDNKGTFVSIYQKPRKNQSFNYYTMLFSHGIVCNDWADNSYAKRLATPSECQKLIDALAKEGKVWNAENKCIEELRWKPKMGEIYYSITIASGASNIQPLTWENDATDCRLFDLNLVFRTYKEAEKCVKKILFVISE